MAGISGYGAYVPIYRLGQATNDWSGRGERAVANFDEDAITMAVAAIRDCLRGEDRDRIGALYLASTTVPFEEKQAAALISTACDLPNRVFASDVGHSIRAGTIALRMAIEGASAERPTLVVASDSRLGAPGSAFEKAFGDGAAALLVGANLEIAVLEASVSVVNEVYDTWRPSGQGTVQGWEERFVFEEGYLKSVQQVMTELRERQGLELSSFDHVVLCAPDTRRHREAARILGLDATKLQPAPYDTIGNTGAASALMQLVETLEQAGPDERILLISYGDGADALVFRTTARLAEYRQTPRRGLGGHVQSKLMVPEYAEYLRWRGLVGWDTGVRRAQRGPSAAALHREKEEVLQFHGVRCQKCGTVQYPPQRICISCHGLDDFVAVRLADEHAKVFTYSMDYIAGTLDVPLVLCVIDFDLGGRAVLTMTDREIDHVGIDMPVELTFRLAPGGAGITNYYWKCMPLRESFVREAARA